MSLRGVRFWMVFSTKGGMGAAAGADRQASVVVFEVGALCSTSLSGPLHASPLLMD